MEVFIKKYFWTVTVAAVVMCSLLAAKAFNNFVEAKYLVDGDVKAKPAAPPPPPEKNKEKPRSKSGAPLADRNMFCNECEPPEPETPVTAPSDPDHVPETSLPLELLATSVSTNDTLSFATVRNTSSEKQGAYWVGGIIPDAGKVMRISGKSLDFQNDSTHRIERISLLSERRHTTHHTVARRPQPHHPKREQKPKNKLEAAMDEGIKKTGENSYEIDRDLVNQVLSNPAKVARGARIVPSIRNGKANGFKLYAIRPSSVFAKIGLMNGDTINQINGFELTTPDKALEVYTKVRSANNLSVKVTRRGKPVTLHYGIR
jgi:general secretion pathway protein C